MNKTQLLEKLNDHPGFDPNRLSELSQGKRLTNALLWEYLCELENWNPLEIVASSHPDWVFVASTSATGKWHRTSAVHQACDCSDHPLSAPCCHLSAAMAAEENRWIAKAKNYGLEVSVDDGNYVVCDRVTQSTIGKLSFNNTRWKLEEQRHPKPLFFEGIDEAIEYLVSVASFGNQLA